MGNETNLVTFSIVFGIILTIGLSIIIWTLGSAYAKSDKYNMRFQIVQYKGTIHMKQVVLAPILASKRMLIRMVKQSRLTLSNSRPRS